MDNNNGSPELTSTNSVITETGVLFVDNFCASWEPNRDKSGYQVWFGASYGDRGTGTYSVRIGEEVEYVMLPNGKTGTLTHEALPNEPKKLGKLSLTIDKIKTRLNHRD